MQQSLKVLVVDDVRVSRDLTRRLLEAANFEVVGEAATGDEAISKFVETEPEVVLLDVHMPGKSGVTALREMKRLNEDAVVIMVTGERQSEVIEDCYKLGACYCLNKERDMPYVAEKVQACVDGRLGRISG